MSAKDKLAKIIALGKRRYIVRYGVIGWGVPTAALFTAWMCYSKGSVQILDVLLPFVLFPLAGIGWGAFMWGVLTKRHAEAMGDGSE